jgi:exonuclease SbcC
VLDLTIDHAGHTWRIVHHVDPHYSNGRGKAEAFLYRDGEPVTEGRLTDYDQAVAAVFPSQRLLLASAYSSQTGGGSFLTLSTAERRELFAELLGLEELQTLHARARAYRKQLTAAVAELERRRADASITPGELQETRASLDTARRNSELAAASRVKAAAASDAATTAAADAAAELRTAQQHEQERATRLERTRQRLEQERARIKALDQTIAELDAAIAAGTASAGELAELQAEAAAWPKTIEDLSGELGEIRAVYRQTKDTIQSSETECAELLAKLRTADRQIAALSRDVAGAPTSEQAEQAAAALEAYEAIAVARQAAEAAEGRHKSIASTLEQLEGRASDLKRLTSVRDSTPCEARTLEGVDCSACAFLSEAEAAAASLVTIEAEIAEYTGRHATALAEATELGKAWRELLESKPSLSESEARGVCESSGRLAETRARLEALEANAAEWQARHVAAKLTKQTAEETLADTDKRGTATRAKVDAQRKTLERLKVLEIEAAAKQAAEKDRPGAVENRERAADQVAELEAEIEASPAAADLTSVRTAAETAAAAQRQAAEHLRAVERRDRELSGEVAVLSERVKTAEARAVLADQLEGLARRLAVEAAAAGHLEAAVGPQGLQAIEIDAAGPDVAAICNELLACVFAGRFALELVTVQEATGSRKRKEVFEARVWDSRSDGGPRDPSSLSGGERVILDEALKLAIASYNARRSGNQIRTLWRDECDGKLDEQIAQEYPALLRAAAAAGGFDLVMFVTHRREVWSHADHLIHVHDGAVDVLEPGAEVVL